MLTLVLNDALVDHGPCTMAVATRGIVTVAKAWPQSSCLMLTSNQVTPVQYKRLVIARLHSTLDTASGLTEPKMKTFIQQDFHS
jgi:hypothetical protein